MSKTALVAYLAILPAFLCTTLSVGQQQPAEPEKLGKVYFPVSCSAEAQPAFNRALAMLHNFWFPQGL